MDKKKIVASVLIGAGALLYGISPIDIVPDLLGPVGLADDAVAILGAVAVITKLIAGAKQPTPTPVVAETKPTFPEA